MNLPLLNDNLGGFFEPVRSNSRASRRAFVIHFKCIWLDMS